MLWTNVESFIRLDNPSAISAVLIAELCHHAAQTQNVVYTRNGSGSLKSGKTLEEYLKNYSVSYRKLVDDGDNNFLWIRENPPSLLRIDLIRYESEISVECILHTTIKEEADCFSSLYKAFFEKKTENSIYMLTHGVDGYDFTKIGILDIPLLRENYEESVINSFDYIVENIISKKPAGKLTILSGPSGTGKSFFVKGLIEKISKDSMCIVLPAKLITELDGPSLVPVLMSHKYQSKWDDNRCEYIQIPINKPLVFIAEDCDNYLVPRDGADSSLISGLLNYTDGIMSDLLNIRFIATTNAPHLKIDPALKRPGRLLKHCFIDVLSAEIANKIYQRLTDGKGKEVFNSSTSLAVVYAKANKSDIYDDIIEEHERRVGFGI